MRQISWVRSGARVAHTQLARAKMTHDVRILQFNTSHGSPRVDFLA